MSADVAETFERLFDKNNTTAYKALQALQKMSGQSDCVYPYMDQLCEMLDSGNSYIRTRGLVLIACNAKWDRDYKVDEVIDLYLRHITDCKPITARQCIKSNILIPSYACFPIPPVILAQAVVILKRLPYVIRKYFLWYTILLI